MFDFTCMYASENAAMVRQRNGHKLLVALVGDSLLEVRDKIQQTVISFFILLKFRCPLNLVSHFHLFLCGHIWSLNLWYLLPSPALLAHGHWHRPRFPGSHGLWLDGEELGSGKNPS